MDGWDDFLLHPSASGLSFHPRRSITNTSISLVDLGFIWGPNLDGEFAEVSTPVLAPSIKTPNHEYTPIGLVRGRRLGCTSRA